MTNTDTPNEVSVQEGYTRWASQYNQDANALIVVEERLALPLLDGISFTHVLDLGAGTGRYAVRLAAQGAQVTAVDQSAGMLTVARQAASAAGAQIRFIEQSLEMALPLETDSFDLVLSALVFCHLHDMAQTLRETYRVLRPGGHLLVTDFHPAVIAAGWRTQFVNSDGIFLLPTAEHTPEDYLTALHNAGFQIQTVLEAPVRDAPTEAFPADVLARDGDKPFCLVILAFK